ncbi:MAG TPA: hypothetical protein VFB19_09960 [Mycobacterium sp.]|nr:hypothetical protein [Mycobacterium sp.]
MTTSPSPREAALAVHEHPTLPSGDDERVVGFGVMGLPFASGHYLALRDFPAATFGPGYRSVWHRDPDGTWTFYATTPGTQSCSRYFGSATPNDAVQCDIDLDWLSPWSLLVRIPGLLEWQVDTAATAATGLMSRIGRRLPERAWTNRMFLAAMSRAAGPALGIGETRLSGTVPNGQRYMVAPTQLWSVIRSYAVLRGTDLGSVEALDRQARLGDFRLPQKGICVVGHAHFDGQSANGLTRA